MQEKLDLVLKKRSKNLNYYLLRKLNYKSNNNSMVMLKYVGFVLEKKEISLIL